MACVHGNDAALHGATAVAVRPGWLRSEMMLEAYGVTEAAWRDATAKQPHFAISTTPGTAATPSLARRVHTMLQHKTWRRPPAPAPRPESGSVRVGRYGECPLKSSNSPRDPRSFLIA